MPSNETEDALKVKKPTPTLFPGLTNRDGPDDALAGKLVEVTPGQARVDFDSRLGCANPNRDWTGSVVEKNIRSLGCGFALRISRKRLGGFICVCHTP